MAEDGTAKTSISQTLSCFILPASILGILALAMFFDFLGTQATEIAKLINEVEISCKSGTLSSLGYIQPVDPAVTVTCTHYLPKIVLFYFLVAVWLVIANVVTLKLFETVRRLDVRFFIAATVAVSASRDPALQILERHPAGSRALAAFSPPSRCFSSSRQSPFSPSFAYRVLEFPERPRSSGADRHDLLWFDRCLRRPLTYFRLLPHQSLQLYRIDQHNRPVPAARLRVPGRIVLLGRETGIPFAAILLIWAVCIDALGVTHGSTVPVRDRMPRKRRATSNSWAGWRRGATARPSPPRNTQSISLHPRAAASMRAMRSAYFLDFLQKKCPAFAHHIFAISGVSVAD